MTRNIIHLTQGICKRQMVKEIQENGNIFGSSDKLAPGICAGQSVHGFGG